MKEAEVTSEEKEKKYWEVDIQKVKPLNRAGGNIRTDYGEKDGSFQELVDSIRENGILVPIRGYRDKDVEGNWISIDGHRRLAAARLLSDEGIEMKVRIIPVDSRKVSDEQLIYEMILTNSGKALSPIETAEAVRRLEAYGHSVNDIAKKFGKSKNLIKNLSLFASAPKRLRDLVEDNKISYSLVVRALNDTSDFNEAVEIIEKALDISKQHAKKKADVDPDTDTSEPLEYKATKKHLNLANNKLDSMKELQMTIRSIEESGIVPTNLELFNFAKKIVKNQITASEIKQQII